MQTNVEFIKKTVQQFLIITVIFILAGSLFNFWHLWVFYLAPSLILFSESRDSNNPIIKAYHSFFIVTAVYLAIGTTLNLWHPTWLIYLLPVIFYLQKN